MCGWCITYQVSLTLFHYSSPLILINITGFVGVKLKIQCDLLYIFYFFHVNRINRRRAPTIFHSRRRSLTKTTPELPNQISEGPIYCYCEGRERFPRTCLNLLDACNLHGLITPHTMVVESSGIRRGRRVIQKIEEKLVRWSLIQQ